MENKYKTIAFFMVFILFFSGSIASAKVVRESENIGEITEEADWTVMYYLCGDVKGYDFWMDSTIENLTKIKSDENINLIVLNDAYGCSNTDIFYINESGEKIIINDNLNFPDEVDTTSPNSLELFCIEVIKNYPAKNYCLFPVMSGGTGWQLICFNDQTNGDIGMSIPMLRGAFANVYEETETKIDVIYTSCAMNMVEVAYELKDYVGYIVGTQDCLAGEYLEKRFYEPLLDLKNDSTLSPEEFASKAPERLSPLEFYYQDEYSGGLTCLNKILNKLPFKKLHAVKYYDSTAVVNLSNIEELKLSIDELGKYLLLNLENCTFRNQIKKSWEATKRYGKCMSKMRLFRPIHQKYHFEFLAYNSYLDLHHFAHNLKKNTDDEHIKLLCQDVMDKNNLSISSIKEILGAGCNGLSIYFPPHKFYYNRPCIKKDLFTPYEDLQFAEETSWDEFLKTYLNIL